LEQANDRKRKDDREDENESNSISLSDRSGAGVIAQQHADMGGREMKLLKSDYGKWVPLSFYYFGDTAYCVLVRMNLKTGMLQFKVKEVGKWSHAVLPKLDVDVQWKLLLEDS
jgi:hypothetical protein